MRAPGIDPADRDKVRAKRDHLSEVLGIEPGQVSQDDDFLLDMDGLISASETPDVAAVSISLPEDTPGPEEPLVAKPGPQSAEPNPLMEGEYLGGHPVSQDLVKATEEQAQQDEGQEVPQDDERPESDAEANTDS